MEYGRIRLGGKRSFGVGLLEGPDLLARLHLERPGYGLVGKRIAAADATRVILGQDGKADTACETETARGMQRTDSFQYSLRSCKGEY